MTVMSRKQQSEIAFRHTASSRFDKQCCFAISRTDHDNSAVIPGQWISTDGNRTMLLALRVPPRAGAGMVEVHVTQKSTRRNAVVEFSLDSRAAGRGCYVV